MKVRKRNGNLEYVSFDKILHRVKKIGAEANIVINYSLLVMKIIDQLYDKIETTNSGLTRKGKLFGFCY